MISSDVSFGSRCAAYPAAPYHGLLHDESNSRGFAKKGVARWAAAERRLSAAQVGLGLILLFLSSAFLHSMSSLTGKALALLLMAGGALGSYGGRRRASSAVSAQLVASLLGMLLAFSLISEVTRDAQIDCALAEVYQRSKATEAAVAAVQQHEAVAALFDRLNALEDSMGMVTEGAAHTHGLRAAQAELKSVDMRYVRERVELLKSKAQTLLDSVLANPELSPETIQSLGEEQKSVLRRRMETADKVLDRISAHHASAADALTFDDYQALLAALTDSEIVPAEHAADADLAAARRELHHAKAAIERSAADSYHNLQVGDAPAHLARIAAQRAAQRAKFDAEFAELLQRQAAKGSDYAADLPQHCVQETRGEAALVTASLAAISLQATTAFTALSLTLRLPVAN